ncbi:hypothetical protein MNB_SUP05-5-838 [hydrothermal vent metagenome]|uniref:Glycosyltransferase RgtA/B/C/D-like domain-containing protein n=1 Tax=hydrothermal vent metagenome TaxID=652676 RepID=A0A1W1BI06_9ZZZZ
MNKYFLLLISIILTGILYVVFYSGLLPQSVVGEMISNTITLSYNPVCLSENYCRSLGHDFLQKIFLVFNANGLIFIFAQVLLFSFSCVFLAKEFYKLTNQKILSYLLLFSIFLNPKVFKYAFTISEEGVFIPLIAIVVALIIKFSRKKDINILLVLSFIIGLAITIRPAAYAMVPLLLIILFVYWQFFKGIRIKTFLYLFVPLVLLVSAESYLYYSNNSKDRETTAGVMLLGKTPLIGINKPLISKYPELSNTIYERGKLVRKTVDSIDDFSLQQYLRNIFNPIYHDLGGLYQPIAQKIEFYKQQFGTRDTVTQGIFKEYAKENPLATIEIIGLNFVGLWQLSEILTTEQRKVFSNWLKQDYINDNYHKERIKYHFSVIKKFAKFAKVAKIVMFILLLATIYLFIRGFLNIFVALKNKKIIDAVSFSSFIFPVMLNGYFLLVAIMINVQMRFILTYWSVLMVILFLTIYLILNKIKQNVS